MYRFSSPKQGWYSDGQTIYYGWAVCGRASTTHYSGPYAEGHPSFALIRNEKVVVLLTGSVALLCCRDNDISVP
jgi:hypothetical protein